MFIAPCCEKNYVCRLCHDEKESHKLDRTSVIDIVCMVCGEEQKVSQRCVACQSIFGKYFCEKCRLYDDEEKGQFHCDGCGLCRIGGRDNFFHCEKCGCCYSVSLKDDHKCIENATRRNCPICNEDLHTSMKDVFISKCGHMLHRECLNQRLGDGLYECPVCERSVVDMQKQWQELDEKVASTPMPEEYRDYYVMILCNDCQKENTVLYHSEGMKCPECGSYNTIWSDIPNVNNNTKSQMSSGDSHGEVAGSPGQVAVSHTQEGVADGQVPGARRAGAEASRYVSDSSGQVTGSHFVTSSHGEEKRSVRQRKPQLKR